MIVETSADLGGKTLWEREQIENKDTLDVILEQVQKVKNAWFKKLAKKLAFR